MSVRRHGLALAASLAFLSAPVLAQNPAAGPESVFHQAYFLERERGHLEEALALYEQVATSRTASAALQAEAKERAGALREDLASLDLARLMPPEAILYAESTQPGQALVRVLEQLGLVGSFQEAAAQGGFALSPELVQGLIGIRGCAVALTRLPMGGGLPRGVLVVNAGELDVLRGAIEAGVLAQGTRAEPIEGLPSWSLPGQVHVAMGARLVIASDAREEIAGVVRRLNARDGKPEASLATSSALGAELAKRDGAPFFVCVNALPVRPLLQGLLAAQANDPRAAIAGAALDVGNLRSFVARLALGDDGLSLEADLHLEEGHRNLVFNLLRGATIDPLLLERIPSGVAAFVTGALNERGPALAGLAENSKGAPVVAALDFGRELFANVAGFGLFVMPGGAPVPSAALLLSSNDPARTQAVLGLLLGLANVFASGQQGLDGQLDEIGGAPTRVFRLPPGIPLYLTTHENTLILSPSEELIEEALEARSGKSVLHDEAFAGELGRLGKDTTLALCAHLGRTLAALQPFLPPEQRDELAPFAPILARTVVALETRHSGTRFGFALAVHGLPRIAGLVGEALRQQRERGEVAAVRAGTQAGLLARFEELATRPGREDAARSLAREQLALLADDPRALNEFAWALLTETRFEQRFDDVAREYSQASNAASDFRVWQYLDTLALAHFRAGDAAEAVRLQERALALTKSAAERAEVEAALARYREADGAVAQDALVR